ncbi:hypothetical protein IE53DRAFT_140561 [Violaceomyces palustris]|uniref:Uncharacterized protein n=1 Tax=Violaceomyces palustris TaxID=1673888 RepID=A0ACD0P6C5_9BASI|nr:hypothetical protein IE53DRAFT_140561 [Violaceomyces palustris]
MLATPSEAPRTPETPRQKSSHHDLPCTPPKRPDKSPACTRSPRSGPKPRLLWKSSLILADGTSLPGLAFVSHLHPFSAPSRSKPLTELAGNDANRTKHGFTNPGFTLGGDETDPAAAQLEVEAGLCLSLEMVRHQPLRIVEILTDEGGSKRSDEAGTSQKRTLARSLSRSSSYSQPYSRPAFAQRSNSIAAGTEKVVSYESSGDIRMYIDPDEPSTLAFFERHFSLEERLADTCPQRTRKVFTVSLDPSLSPSLHSSAVSASAAGDIFSSSLPSLTASIASGASEIIIFGQLEDSLDDGLQYPSGELNDMNGPEPRRRAKSLRMVIGRKVVKTVKLTEQAPTTQSQQFGRGFIHPLQMPTGRGRTSESLEASLITLFRGSNSTPLGWGHLPPRPDDPLPRGSIASLLQARERNRSLGKGTSSAKASTSSSSTPLNSSSPFLKPSSTTSVPPSSSQRDLRKQHSFSKARDPGDHDGDDKIPTAIERVDEQRGGSEGAYVRSNSTSAPTLGGSHTPGRRGEKRHRKRIELAQDDADGNLMEPCFTSPTKRRRQRADRIVICSNQAPSSLIGESRFSSTTPTPGPDQPSENGEIGMMIRETSSDAKLGPFVSGLDLNRSVGGSGGASVATEGMSVMERSNRTTIKKVVHNQLLARGADKGSEDYLACFNPTCQGTWTALRKEGGGKSRLDKSRVERIVKLHLDMYL